MIKKYRFSHVVIEKDDETHKPRRGRG